MISRLSREGGTEKAKQGFGPGGLKKVLKKVLTRAKQCDIINKLPRERDAQDLEN